MQIICSMIALKEKKPVCVKHNGFFSFTLHIAYCLLITDY